MRAVEGYVLRNVHGVYYLLPIGQNIALQRKSLQLNDTGVFLWNALSNGTDSKDLLPLLVQHCKAGITDFPALQSDIDSFIKQLSSMNLLSDDNVPVDCSNYFRIANIVVGYHGPEAMLHPSLLDFSCKADAIDQHWIIKTPPTCILMGEVLIHTKDMEISRNSDSYILHYFHYTKLIKAQITLDGTHAYFYCIPPFEEMPLDELFHSFRFAFLIYAQTKGVFALHSSSILYNNTAWLFSASSGTGKSTHAKLWLDAYQVPTLNGDLNLISIQDSQPMVWGLPWCGTSLTYSTKSYPLGGITLLKQHSVNKLQSLSLCEQQLMVMQRLISPIWTEEMLDYNLDFSGKLVDCIYVLRLLCTKEVTAAQMMKQFIDNTLK